MATVKRVLHIKENGEDIPVYPETSVDQVKLEDGTPLGEVFKEDLVAIFEKALQSDTHVTQNP